MTIEPLVDPAWVAAHLSDPSLRIFDCTILLTPTPDDPLRIESGRTAWKRVHIPGSGFPATRVSPSCRSLGAPGDDGPPWQVSSPGRLVGCR
jgi:3-mercaptopyruvate sulfurtransferase SseA